MSEKIVLRKTCSHRPDAVEAVLADVLSAEGIKKARVACRTRYDVSYQGGDTTLACGR